MKKKNNVSSTYHTATGAIRFNMTNDYMFRAVNQKNPKVTKGIICSVLHLNPEIVQSVEITNPIELGEDIDDKTFMLDINILLNNSAIINLDYSDFLVIPINVSKDSFLKRLGHIYRNNSFNSLAKAG